MAILQAPWYVRVLLTFKKRQRAMYIQGYVDFKMLFGVMYILNVVRNLPTEGVQLANNATWN